MGNDWNRRWTAAALSLLVGGCSTGVGLGESSEGAELGDSSTGNADGEDGYGDTTLDTGQGDSDACVMVTLHPEGVVAGADIIMVVDNSTSMGFEATEIQARMNDFSTLIIESGIDVRVVLVSSYPDDENGICIDPPLGGGGCPTDDDNAPLFTHVEQKIESHDAWERLLDTYDEWSLVTRSNAIKHVVVVSDDTSDMKWEDFHDDFRDLDPGHENFVHHSVVCHSNCDSSYGIGDEYITLSEKTGGMAADLCDQDFQSVFDVLATELSTTNERACEFAIPQPPAGMELDLDRVDVGYHDDDVGTLPLDRVESAGACDDVDHGWHYDDPDEPSAIVLCSQICDALRDSAEGSISLELSCS